jgi:hypothetical protein
MARARAAPKRAETYRHEDEVPLRPDVGTQAQFKQRKPPKTYRYDSSLSPALDWDGQNPVRELGEWLLAQIEEASKLDRPHRFDSPRSFDGIEVGGLADAVEQLKSLSKPFLDWSGKAERLSFDVPTLPLFVHERLSTKAILETLKGPRASGRGWPTVTSSSMPASVDIACDRGLSVYDSCYLALAETSDALPVTADSRLAAAAPRAELLP